MSAIGDKLRALRISSGLTQSELGKKISISPANVSKYESGKLEPNLEILNSMSRVFNVSMDYLLGKTDNRSTDDEKEQLADGIIQILIDMGEIEPGEELTDEKRDRLFEMVKMAIKMSKL